MHTPRQPSRCTLLVRAPSSLLTRALLLTVIVGTTALWVLPTRSGAQVISLKTIPVATGDQFLVLPSERLGMGGVSIALDDMLLDPFVNPAKGALIDESVLLGPPTFYGISNAGGAGRSLPFSALFRSDDGFGAISFALQQLQAGQRQDIIFFASDVIWAGPQQRLSEASATNLYVNGTVGRELGESGFSVGAGASWAGLDALDGVEHLYALSNGIAQSGHQADYRMGLFWERREQHFEAVLVHNRFNMRHDVSYIEWLWDEATQRTIVTERVETNRDRTRTTGLQLGFSRPITESGWKVGGTWTVNRKTHPKIPNYEIMNIPRDPGISWAYDFGVGIAKSSGPATFGIDVVVEPIWSETWAEAAADTTNVNDDVIRKGDRTIENDFFFTNVNMRMGLAYELERVLFQAGVEVRSYAYTLDQRDHVQDTRRDQEESWMEWSPSIGAKAKFAEFEIGYAGRMTTGSGRPGVQWTGERADAALAADFILAPSGPLTLQDAIVITHQITVSVPIR